MTNWYDDIVSAIVGAINAISLKKSDVADNLTTTTNGKVLDAKQGKALKDLINGKADKIEFISTDWIVSWWQREVGETPGYTQLGTKEAFLEDAETPWEEVVNMVCLDGFSSFHGIVTVYNEWWGESNRYYEFFISLHDKYKTFQIATTSYVDGLIGNIEEDMLQ